MQLHANKVFRTFFMTMILMALSVAAAAQKDPDAAVDLTKKCSYTFTSVSKSKRENLNDNRIKSSVTVPVKGEAASFSVMWKESISPKRFYIQWTVEPDAFRIEWQNIAGETLYKENFPKSRALNQWVEIAEGASGAVISSDSDMQISEFRVYSAGNLPANYHLFEETPKKLDYLIVSTHPDDDQLFMGAVTPIYGADRGLTGTVLFMTCRERGRYEEALNGLWVAGQRTMPLFAWQKDGSPEYRDVRKYWDYDETVLLLVRYFREFRPEVVVTHDLKGEYGQALHRITSEAVIEAVECAQKQSYDPESVRSYGAWQVKKLYIHLYGENTITLDMRSPLSAFNGRTALQVVTDAYREHKSQQYLWFTVSDSWAYSPTKYGLYYSAVGPDTPGVNDMFENLEETEKELTFTASVTDGIVKLSADRPVNGIALSKISHAPAIDSNDWIPAEGKEPAVYKSDGDYYLYVRYGDGKIAGGDAIRVSSSVSTVLNAKGMKPLTCSITEALAQNGSCIEDMNRLIFDRVEL